MKNVFPNILLPTILKLAQFAQSCETLATEKSKQKVN